MWRIVSVGRSLCARFACTEWRSSNRLLLVVWCAGEEMMSTQDVGQRNATIDQPKEIIKWVFSLSSSSLSLSVWMNAVGWQWLASCLCICKTYCVKMIYRLKNEHASGTRNDDDDDDEFFNPTHFNRRADFPHLGLPMCVRRVCVFIIFGLVCAQMNFPHVDVKWRSRSHIYRTPYSVHRTPTNTLLLLFAATDEWVAEVAAAAMFHHLVLVSRTVPLRYTLPFLCKCVLSVCVFSGTPQMVISLAVMPMSLILTRSLMHINVLYVPRSTVHRHTHVP